MRHGLKNLVIQLQVRFQVDISTLILRGVAVPRSREDGDATTVMLNFIALHADLMRANDGLQPVSLAEALGHVRAELQTHTSLAGSTTGLGLRIRPEHLHHQTLAARLSLAMSVEFPDIVERGLVVREESAVQHEILVADQGGQRQGREGFGKHFEHGFGVFGLAFALEAVDHVHVIRFVVSAIDEDVVGEEPLVCVEEEGDFRRPRSTIDKVAVEEVGVVCRRTSIASEDLHQIEELS